MKPSPYTIYKMKEGCFKSLTAGLVSRCAIKCGNKFRYLANSKSYVNMECMRCGYKYHTNVGTFSERYDEAGADLNSNNPNSLFKTKRLL